MIEIASHAWLRRRLCEAGLSFAPGTLVIATPDQSLTVVRNGSTLMFSQIDPDSDAQEVVNALRRGEVVAKGPEPTSRLIVGYGSVRTPDDFLPTLHRRSGMKGSDVFVTQSHALFVPSSVPRRLRRLITTRFIASLPDPTAQALTQVLNGDASILEVRVSSILQEALPLQVPPADRVALFDERDPTWRSQDLEAEVGRLRPASRVAVRTHKGLALASAACLPSLGSIGTKPLLGTSVASDSREARRVAIAEAYERHMAGVTPASDLVVAPGTDIADALNPNRVASFLPWQINAHPDMTPYSAHESRLWVRTKRLDGSTAAVLADLVFYPFGRANHRRHMRANSSGMAAHTTVMQAARRAWAELLERDAFMRHWLGRTPGRRLEVRVRPGTPEEGMLDDLRADGWRLHLLQLGDAASLPVVCAVAVKNRNIALGASADRPHVALAKAVREAWCGVFLPRDTEDVPEPEAVRTASDHRRLYRWGGMSDHVSFLWGTDETLPLSELGELAPPPDEMLLYVWPKFMTHPFRVVRAVCPSMIPITFGFGLEPLGREDAASLVVHGRGAPLDRPLLPHPFP